MIATPSLTRAFHLTEVQWTKPTYLAVGIFDGVHLGHQTLLSNMIAEARMVGATPVVLTFFPHPITVIQQKTGRLYLQSLEDRVASLAKLGIELIITHPFNEEVRQTTATEFVEMMCRHLRLQQLWGGHFSLGYNREGNAHFLREQGKEKGFTVQEVTVLDQWQGERVSSSRIRQALAIGDMETVTACLGRPFTIKGQVVEGQKRGRTIGFPTANLALWDELLLPTNGVYATYAHLNGEQYPAATNIGVRPTVNGHGLTVEAHLLDFAGNLYRQELALSFVSRLRDEQKFASLDALTAQIKIDVAQVRDLLG